jgi:hypothetical protein
VEDRIRLIYGGGGFIAIVGLIYTFIIHRILARFVTLIAIGFGRLVSQVPCLHSDLTRPKLVSY